MNELKKCPFCGSKNVELRKGMMFNGAIHCTNCTADVVFDAVRLIVEEDYDWQSAITEKWNMRTGETE